MAYYRIRTSDGTTVTRQALRIRSDATTLYLEDRSTGPWRVVGSWRLNEVTSVQRRFTENNGTWTWVNESLPAPADVGGWN